MEEIFWLVEYLASFLEVFLCTYFCGAFIERKEWQIKSKAICLAGLASIIIILLNQIQLFSYITTSIFIILNIVIQWILYKKRYLLSVGLVLVYITSLTIIDFIITYFMTAILKIDINYIMQKQNFIRLACILLSKSILIILVVSLKKILSYRKFIPSLYTMLMAVCSLFLFVSNMVLVHLELTLEERTSSFMIIFFIASFGIEIILFFLVIKIGDSYEQKQNNLLMEMHNKMLQKSLEETKQNFDLWKQSIHDYKNHMIILKQMAEDGRIEELQSYLEKENELMKKNMFYIKTGNSVADTIINMKRNIAEKYNILFVVHENLSSDMEISDMDMGNMLGNLLDNAIEASIKEEEPYIDILIKQEKNFFLLNIKNKYTQISKKGLVKTTKQDVVFHGIGLQSVKKIVKKYHGEINIEQENQEYIVNIIIPNK